MMGEVVLTIDGRSHELARRQVIAAAATDLRHAADELDSLAEWRWPVNPARVEDGRNALELVRESIAAVDEIGWPDVEAS
jgi:hypothetical protein